MDRRNSIFSHLVFKHLDNFTTISFLESNNNKSALFQCIPVLNESIYFGILSNVYELRKKDAIFQLRDMHDTSVHSTTALSLPDQAGHSTQASYTILNSQTLQILRFR